MSSWEIFSNGWIIDGWVHTQPCACAKCSPPPKPEEEGGEEEDGHNTPEPEEEGGAVGETQEGFSKKLFADHTITPPSPYWTEVLRAERARCKELEEEVKGLKEVLIRFQEKDAVE